MSRFGRDFSRRFLLIAGMTFLLCIAIGAASAQMVTPDAKAMSRRAALLKLDGNGAQVIGKLTKALGDKDPLVARTAARLLGRCGKSALPALDKALGNPDVQVRRIACAGLASIGEDAVESLARALTDDNPLVRQAAVFALARIPANARIVELLTEAGTDEAGVVSQAAIRALASSFTILDKTPLPKAGWKFRTDPERVGEDGKWFAVDFDDTDWDDIEIEKAWTQQGYDYIGWSWYRRTIDLPARDKAGRVEMLFEGVDESAWLWVNGQYIGVHDIGPEGWNKAFRLDVTDALKWGEANQITVRAMNTAHAGGIWKPVHIVVLAPVE